MLPVETGCRGDVLEISRVRGRRNLAIPFLARKPSFDVVLRDRRFEIAGRDVDHAVGKAELLNESFLDGKKPFVLVG